MTMDISGIFDGFIGAMSALVQWMKNTTITAGGVTVSVFGLTVAVLVIDIIIMWFVPWGGDTDE